MKEYNREHEYIREIGRRISFLSCFNIIQEEEQGYADEYKELVDSLANNEYA